jgi:dihydroorotase
MGKRILIKGAYIVNENSISKGSVLIEGTHIYKVYLGNPPKEAFDSASIIDAEGKYLIPGIIDDQVHFREPGLTHKADIYTEAKAAIAGGVTSFMEMPNTTPQTITQELLEEKYRIASEKSLANYSFYIGATNDNLAELLKTDPKTVCGMKIFMGSSTGNMLVDNPKALEQIFEQSSLLIAVHCEDEQTIKNNTRQFIEKYGENIPIWCHHLIRSEEACYLSSHMAVQLAQKHNTRLHLLHLSTAKEIQLLTNQIPLSQKRITSEVCVHHLWFDESDYEKLGTRIKWNPAVKTKNDKEKLMEALLNDTLDVVATDHAPHTMEEKNNLYTKAPSGGPLVQHSLSVMLELLKEGKISLEKIVQKMCHAPAETFQIAQRGYIREKYYADLVLIDLNERWTVNTENILYKCRWSPFEGFTFTGKVTHTIVNGNLTYANGIFNEANKGMRLTFQR